MSENFGNELKRLTGVSIPLGALRTEKTPVIGEYTSLPEFAEFCKDAGLSVIQLLPVLDTGTSSSPYSTLSAFALHPIYISIYKMENFTTCYEKNPSFRHEYDEFLSLKDDKRFNYTKILNLKNSLLKKIFLMTVNSDKKTIDKYLKDFYAFIEKNAVWLNSYCVYKTLKDKYHQAGCKNWFNADLNLSKDQIIERWIDQTQVFDVRFYAWEQYIAHLQFSEAAQKIREMGITLKGDLPILLNEDSCDVWHTPELFNMKFRAGSPPDKDNPTGQNWGFPVYDWKAQKENGYAWWKLRLSETKKYFDAFRLDHIQGFFRFWAFKDGELTAEMGATVPYSAITTATLLNNGFSTERIRWLSEPHIPTEEIFRLTGNVNQSIEILSVACDRIGREQLWNFKSCIKTSGDIKKLDFSNFDLDEEIQEEIREKLLGWWKNRVLIEVKKGNFLPYHNYKFSSAWNSLTEEEKEKLSELLDANEKKQEKQWRAQAESIFSEIIPSAGMTACGEDLGIKIDCMGDVMKKFGILGLKVVRWCRDWRKENSPFEDLQSYSKLSLVTTSVHDSSTLRQWWNEEKTSAKEFERAFLIPKDSAETPRIYEEKFNPQIAEKVLSAIAHTSGAWFVPPIQDWLYLDENFYAENAKTERINIPGTVSDFNWTWRMPANVDELKNSKILKEKIKKISKIHDSVVQ